MFDIGFSELIVCAIVGLIVIGPERLPEAVRTVGLWVGRIKRSLRETREELERQVGMEDVRRQLHTEEMMRTLDNMQEEIDAALNYERMGSKAALEHKAEEIQTETTVVETEQPLLTQNETIPIPSPQILEKSAPPITRH
ncbi:MAG: twin-arginine translocase subunit TatB [Gammaproteobacteria bacterium]|nr:MAG: twin-arginine translocase subunit TatB [Gammaproteobacteria bacterium]